MSDAGAGWFPPDPSAPTELRYWDGSAWTERFRTQKPVVVRANSVPHAKSGPVITTRKLVSSHPWLTSWPVIIVGLCLFVVPGVWLFWFRQDQRPWKKVLATIAAVPFFIASLGMMAAAAPSHTPDADGQAQTPVAPASETPSALPSEAGPAGTPPGPSASATPSPTASAVLVGDPAANGTAMAAALELTVKGRAPKTGYSREQFGSGWVDIDRNGCDTRNDELKFRLTNKAMSGSCKVLSGDLQDPYTGTTIHFEYGGASEVDIDHMVALSDAWQKGAASWQFAQRVAFANDPLNLEPVDASVNRQKSDGDTATWLPPNKRYRCEYVARQVAVKTKYGVWVTQAELDAMVRVLDTCPNQALPDFGSQPIIASNTGGPAPTPAPTTSAPAPAPAPVAVPAPAPAPTPALDPRFPYCKDAIPAGYGNYVKGVDPEYDWYRDADGDGIVCEH
jgi:hypothetical protein